MASVCTCDSAGPKFQNLGHRVKYAVPIDLTKNMWQNRLAVTLIDAVRRFADFVGLVQQAAVLRPAQ